MNIYLEKVADMIDLEEGVRFDPTLGSLSMTDSTRSRLAETFMKDKFQAHKLSGANTFGAIGAGLGAVIGTSPLFNKGLKARSIGSAIGAIAGYGLGSISGLGLASGGNQQTLDSKSATEWEVSKNLFRRHYQSLQPHEKSFYVYPKISYEED